MTMDTSAVDTPARVATSARVGRRSRPGRVRVLDTDENVPDVEERGVGEVTGGGSLGVALLGSGRMGAFQELLADAYVAELAAFAAAVRGGTPAPVGGEDARAALAIALAAAQSVRAGRPVPIDEVAR
jgi:predicted dehydrogenase